MKWQSLGPTVAQVTRDSGSPFALYDSVPTPTTRALSRAAYNDAGSNPRYFSPRRARAIAVLIIALFASPLYAQHPARPEIVAEQKAALIVQGADLSGPCGAFKITKAVAWRLQAEGVGLLAKEGGNNCDGYSVDFVTYADGSGVDILGDAGGANVPGWDVSEPVGALLGRWRAPIPPNAPQPQPVPNPGTNLPTPGYDLDIIQRLMRVENNQLIANVKLDQIQQTTLETHALVKEAHGWVKDFMVFSMKYVVPTVTGILATWQVTKE